MSVARVSTECCSLCFTVLVWTRYSVCTYGHVFKGSRSSLALGVCLLCLLAKPLLVTSLPLTSPRLTDPSFTTQGFTNGFILQSISGHSIFLITKTMFTRSQYKQCTNLMYSRSSIHTIPKPK